jgi:hypothetical protein
MIYKVIKMFAIRDENRSLVVSSGVARVYFMLGWGIVKQCISITATNVFSPNPNGRAANDLAFD